MKFIVPFVLDLLDHDEARFAVCTEDIAGVCQTIEKLSIGLLIDH